MTERYKQVTLNLPDRQQPKLMSDEEALVLKDIKKLVRLLNSSGETLKHSLSDLDACVDSVEMRLAMKTWK